VDWTSRNGRETSDSARAAVFVRLDARGIVITLMASKASQDQAEEIVVPAHTQDMPNP
jgi:hypothetical protein